MNAFLLKLINLHLGTNKWHQVERKQQCHILSVCVHFKKKYNKAKSYTFYIFINY